MRPQKITISGLGPFSDIEDVTVDLSQVDRIALVGDNGAGKSTILTAIPYALFGYARTGDPDQEVNSESSMAKVALEFLAQGSLYRVTRTRKKPGKIKTGKSSAILERSESANESGWALVCSGVREVDREVEELIGASQHILLSTAFSLQGDSGRLAAARPQDRRSLLFEILRLDRFGSLSSQAQLKTREIEANRSELAGKIEALNDASQAASGSRARLRQLKKERTALKRSIEEARAAVQTASTSKVTEETRLADVRSEMLEVVADIETAQKLVDEAGGAKERLAASESELAAVVSELQSADERRAELRTQDAAATEILQSERPALAKQTERLSTSEAAVAAASATEEAAAQRLKAERQRLSTLDAKIAKITEDGKSLKGDVEERKATIADLESAAAETAADLDEQSAAVAQTSARLDLLKAGGIVDGEQCTACGSELTEEHRRTLEAEASLQIKKLSADLRESETRLDALKARASDAQELADAAHLFVSTGEQRLGDLRQTLAEAKSEASQVELKEAERLAQDATTALESARATVATLASRIDPLRSKVEDAQLILDGNVGARESLASRVAELETTKVACQQEMKELAGLDPEEARAALNKLQTHLGELEQSEESAVQAIQSAADELKSAEDNVAEMEPSYTSILEEMGALEAKEQAAKEAQAEAMQTQIQADKLDEQSELYRLVSRAFGSNGVPALILDGVVAELSDTISSLLNDLSDGMMAATLQTVTETKSGTRKPSLDLVIEDRTAIRRYESFSGGEKMRIDIAVRVGLSLLLAKRAGAPLETLVIDEGFGSLDQTGINHLAACLDKLSARFPLIMVVTHVPEVAEAFPARLVVSRSGGQPNVRFA